MKRPSLPQRRAAVATLVAISFAAPAFAADRDHHDRGRDHRRTERHRPVPHTTYSPGYVYAPPPVYYAPPPVAPSLNFFIPLRFK